MISKLVLTSTTLHHLKRLFSAKSNEGMTVYVELKTLEEEETVDYFMKLLCHKYSSTDEKKKRKLPTTYLPTTRHYSPG
jgi:hypothetical protein